jgi:hypothetical protein
MFQGDKQSTLKWMPRKISLRVICAFCNLFSYLLMYARKGSFDKKTTINMRRIKKKLWIWLRKTVRTPHRASQPHEATRQIYQPHDRKHSFQNEEKEDDDAF